MTLSLVHDVSGERDAPNKRGYAGFVPAPFDYGGLAADLASAARESAERIRQSQRDHIIEVGQELLRIKEILAYGHFTDWVDRALNFSPASARNYMAAARAFSDKPLMVSVLPPATLYRLAGAPSEVRNCIVARVEAGEYIDRDEVAEAIRRPKQEAAETKRQANGQAQNEAKRRRDRREQSHQQRWKAELDQERQQRQGAADELVRFLATRFDTTTILWLSDLWEATRHSDVVEAVGRSAHSGEVSS